LQPPGMQELRVPRERARLTEKKVGGVTWRSVYVGVITDRFPFPQANLTSGLPELSSTRQRTTAITSNHVYGEGAR